MISRRDFLTLGGLLPAALLPGTTQLDFNNLLVGTGVDDTAALQTTFDNLNNRYGYTGQNAVVFLAGKFKVTNTLFLRDKYRVSIIGFDACISADFTDKPLIDAQGSTYLRLSGVHLVAPNAFYYGRNANGTGGGLSLDNMMIQGNIHIAQADTSTFDRVTVYGMTELTTHHSGICPSSTYKGNSWRDCWLVKGLTISGMIQNVAFQSCYFTDTINVCDAPGAGTGNQVHNLSFENCIVEGSKGFIQLTNSVGLHGLKIDNLNYSCQYPYMLELDSPYGLRNAYIHHFNRSNSSIKLIHLKQGAIMDSLITCSSEGIFTEAGTVIKNNTINCLGTQPFCGLGINSKNRVISGFYNSEALSGTRLAQTDAPVNSDFCKADAGIIRFRNTQPTTLVRLAPNITAVFLVFDGLTTVGGAGSYFPNVDKQAPPAGTVWQMVNTTGWYWQKVS